MNDGPPRRFLNWQPFPEDKAAPLSCLTCDGDGWFTETLEGADGRDADLDTPCRDCGTTGLETP